MRNIILKQLNNNLKVLYEHRQTDRYDLTSFSDTLCIDLSLLRVNERQILTVFDINWQTAIFRVKKLSWKRKWATVKSLKADVSSISPLSIALTLTLYGGPFTFSTYLLTLNYLFYSLTDAAPQFPYKLTPFIQIAVFSCPWNLVSVVILPRGHPATFDLNVKDQCECLSNCAPTPTLTQYQP